MSLLLLEAPPTRRIAFPCATRKARMEVCAIGPSATPVPTIILQNLAPRPNVCYNEIEKAVNIVSQLRKLKQQVQKQNNLKIKRQKTMFSTCFIITLIISLIMLVICAINKAPTFTTTVISGCAWLIFGTI